MLPELLNQPETQPGIIDAYTSNFEICGLKAFSGRIMATLYALLQKRYGDDCLLFPAIVTC
jgi:hypothetical protein